MRIIGIDPGYAIVGYAILDFVDDKKTLKKYGTIQTSSKIDFPSRMLQIYEELNNILSEYNPDFASVEQIFFFFFLKTAIDVA